ncbi:MAG: hypothetical protein K8I03_02195 [Ignavibacteria bacterium]|nr:hypothetical protein [Ignavibacteria bacterium]
MKILRISLIFLLFFNFISALFGGLHLTLDPSGSSIGLPFEWINNTIFRNYFLPGLFLTLLIAVFSLYTGIMILLNRSYGWLLVVSEGIMLCIWIAVETIIIPMQSGLQYFYGFLGMIFIITGLFYRN